MSALIFRSSKTLLSPLAGTPVVPDIMSSLYWELDPASLSALAPGDHINSWVASGVAPILNRTYNFQYGSWGKPTYDPVGGPSGKPAAMFNGAQQICNSAGTTAHAEPLTYAFVCKSNAFANTQSRIFSDSNHWIVPSPTGYSISTTGGTTTNSANPTNEWVSVIVVFTGSTTVFKVGSGAILSAPSMAVQNSGRNLIGGNPTALTGVGLNGGIAYGAAFTRAFNNSDIDALALSLKRRFNLTT